MFSRDDRVQLPMMQPLRRPSIIDQAELELRSAIYYGTLRPGDSVPEVKVSREMGISRSSLREACQRLVRDGLLTQFPGRGLFVTVMDAQTMSDFLQYRVGIEMQSATIVAERVRELRERGEDEAVDALLAPLQKAREQTRAALEQDAIIDAGNADLDLHQRLAEITRNRFLSTAMNTIVILTRMGSFSDPLGFGVRADLTESHDALLEALAEGDASRARRLLRASLGTLAERLGSEPAADEDDIVRDPDLLEHPEPEWPTLGEGQAPA